MVIVKIALMIAVIGAGYYAGKIFSDYWHNKRGS